MEFDPLQERTEGDLRIIERARLRGVGLVDSPAYPASRVEVRARMGRTVRARIPSGKRLACDCLRTAAGRAAARWAKYQRDTLQTMFDEVFSEVAEETAIAAVGAYGQPLASTARGTMRGKVTKGGDLEVDIDLPEDASGRAVLAAHESSGLVARPFVDDARAKYEVADDVAEYTEAPLRGRDSQRDRPARRLAGSEFHPFAGRLARAGEAPEDARHGCNRHGASDCRRCEAGHHDCYAAACSGQRLGDQVRAGRARGDAERGLCTACVGWLAEAPASGLRSNTTGPFKWDYSPAHRGALRASGAMGLLSPWKVRRAGVIAGDDS